jgi:hypothetical protein
LNFRPIRSPSQENRSPDLPFVFEKQATTMDEGRFRRYVPN